MGDHSSAAGAASASALGIASTHVLSCSRNRTNSPPTSSSRSRSCSWQLGCAWSAWSLGSTPWFAEEPDHDRRGPRRHCNRGQLWGRHRRHWHHPRGVIHRRHHNIELEHAANRGIPRGSHDLCPRAHSGGCSARRMGDSPPAERRGRPDQHVDRRRLWRVAVQSRRGIPEDEMPRLIVIDTMMLRAPGPAGAVDHAVIACIVRRPRLTRSSTSQRHRLDRA
jgi:hypothetical protein